MSSTCRLNREHPIIGGGRVELCAALQDFDPGIQCMNAILLWMDKENQIFQGIERRGCVADAWPRDAIKPTSCLVDCLETATPAPRGRFSIIVRPYATGTRSLDPIGPTTLWYGIVTALFIPSALRTVVAFRLRAVTTDLAPPASKS